MPKKQRTLIKQLQSIAAAVGAATGNKKGVIIPAEHPEIIQGWLSSGIQEIDDALSARVYKGKRIKGSGEGVPMGRIIEIRGMEATAKTSLAVLFAAEAQRRGWTVAFQDVEHALDRTFVKALGADPDHWLFSEPLTAEEALQQQYALLQAGARVCILDSVAALTPKAELEGKNALGEQARLMSKWMRRINGLAAKKGALVIYINQVRYKIGVKFGDPQTTSGGVALKFYASQRIKMAVIKTLKNSKGKTGVRVRVEVTKNKVAPPFGQAIFDILWGRGIQVPKPTKVKIK